MHKFRVVKGKTAWVALKLDMEKAYDRLEWDFIRACLKQYGFHNRFIHLLMECITTTTYSLLVNGESAGMINPTRGIRQGDPLSPYIFILCMEVLNSMLNSAAQRPKSGVGIKLCPTTDRLPCLLFADDCLLFCKADSSSCWTVKNILDQFCVLSGQLVNYQKSVLTFSKNATSAHRQTVAGIFNITHSISLGKYLGCPVLQKRPNSSTFQELLNKARTKLAGWKANMLSKAGRAVLIQSTLEALPAHTMQCFKLPVSTSAQLDCINREFFWKKTNNANKGLPLVAWTKVCMPKTMGGLGLRRAQDVNLAFQCKLAWKVLQDKSSMWASVMRAKYLRTSHLFDCPSKHGASLVWRNILKCRDILKQGMRWSVGTGQDISFWFDNWIENQNLIELLNLQDVDGLDPRLKLSEFIQDKKWDFHKLQQTIPNQMILEKIMGIPLTHTETRDELYWALTSSGRFSIQSALSIIQGSTTANSQSWDYKWIWAIDTMPKIKIFLWQICHNALPVRGSLLYRGCNVDPVCPLCYHELETIEHLFWDCPGVAEVWTLAAQHQWIPQIQINRLRDWSHFLSNWPVSFTGKYMQHLTFLLWGIWKARNGVVFHSESFNPMKCLIRAKSLSAQWRIRTCMSVDTFLQGCSFIPHKNHHFIRWEPPSPGRVKINFDGSCQNGLAAGGFVIRDWRGTVLKLGAASYGRASILLAEGRALRDGLQAAFLSGFRCLEIEGDNKLIIQAIQGQVSVPWELCTIVKDIQTTIDQCNQVLSRHIYREANMAADWLSKLGHSVPVNSMFTECAAMEFRTIIHEDWAGRTLVRRGT